MAEDKLETELKELLTRHQAQLSIEVFEDGQGSEAVFIEIQTPEKKINLGNSFP